MEKDRVIRMEKNKKGLRRGWTTGTCAQAASRSGCGGSPGGRPSTRSGELDRHGPPAGGTALRPAGAVRNGGGEGRQRPTHLCDLCCEKEQRGRSGRDRRRYSLCHRVPPSRGPDRDRRGSWYWESDQGRACPACGECGYQPCPPGDDPKRAGPPEGGGRMEREDSGSCGNPRRGGAGKADLQPKNRHCGGTFHSWNQRHRGAP